MEVPPLQLAGYVLSTPGERELLWRHTRLRRENSSCPQGKLHNCLCHFEFKNTVLNKSLTNFKIIRTSFNKVWDAWYIVLGVPQSLMALFTPPPQILNNKPYVISALQLGWYCGQVRDSAWELFLKLHAWKSISHNFVLFAQIKTSYYNFGTGEKESHICFYFGIYGLDQK